MTALRSYFGIIVLFIFALFSAGAAGIAELELLEDSCNEDGTLTITAKNPKDDPIFTDTVVITAKHADDAMTRTIEGVWDREEIVYDPTPMRGIARFQSRQGMLDVPGDYQVFLNYRGCRDDPRCRIAFLLQSCPGEKIRCGKDDVTTKSCIIRGDTLYLYTHAEQGLGIDAKDLLFHFESSRRNLDGVHLFPGITIDTTTEGYIIQLALEDGEVITSAGVQRDVCGQNASIVACETPDEKHVEATAIIVDIPEDTSDSMQDGMEAVTGAVAGTAQGTARASILGKSFMILLVAVALGIAYLVYARRAQEKKRDQYLRKRRYGQNDDLVVDDQDKR